MGLGLLLGPVGAIIGGLGGLAAGAWIGDALSRRSRGLSGPEREYLRGIFLDSLNYDAVRIERGSALAVGGRARTAENTIGLLDRDFVGNTLNLAPSGLATLAHEMGHVWQYQNGGLDYIPSSLVPQAFGDSPGRGRNNTAYNWPDAVSNHVRWEDWNAEQQAECISSITMRFAASVPTTIGRLVAAVG